MMLFPISDATPIAFPGPPPRETDVVVIGGGVIGVCTALFLARKGRRVVLLEKGRIAAEQSSRNWGWIRQQGRDPQELPIMVEANHLWTELAAQTNVDIGLVRSGVTYLAESETELQSFANWLPHATAQGVDTELLDRSALKARFPDLAKSGIHGALTTPSDMRAEPWVTVPALAGIAVREGAVIVEDCAARKLDLEGGRVTGVHSEAGRIACCDVVVAGGAWSSLFLRAHGVAIPQLSVRASAGATEPVALPHQGAAAAADFAFRMRADGGASLAAGGFHELFIGPGAAEIRRTAPGRSVRNALLSRGSRRISGCLDNQAPVAGGRGQPLRKDARSEPEAQQRQTAQSGGCRRTTVPAGRADPLPRDVGRDDRHTSGRGAGRGPCRCDPRPDHRHGNERARVWHRSGNGPRAGRSGLRRGTGPRSWPVPPVAVQRREPNGSGSGTLGVGST